MSTSDPASLPRARIRIGRLTGEGRDFSLEADAEEREAVARRLAILDIDRLAATLRIVPFRGGFRVTGKVEAELHQACVVTLVPVAERIEEQVDRIFMPSNDVESGEAPNGVFVDPESDEEPDWFDGEWLELGPLIVETVALALNPYPRAPGVVFDSGQAADDEEESPFAALRDLKTRGGPR